METGDFRKFTTGDDNVLQGDSQLIWHLQSSRGDPPILLLEPQGWLYSRDREWLENQFEIMLREGWKNILWSFRKMETTRYETEFIVLAKISRQLIPCGGWVGACNFSIGREGALEFPKMLGSLDYILKSGLQILERDINLDETLHLEEIQS